MPHISRPPLSHNTQHFVNLSNRKLTFAMAPKPASTAGKAPTASKAPAKTTTDKPAAKTAKKTAADGDKKKKRKVRKETYASYIYKGALHRHIDLTQVSS